MITILSFLVVITIIVFIHEYGHFWFARKFGVKVEIFSIGFGKEIFGFTDKHGTRWKFSMIPMGGYVKMFGDSGAASNKSADIDNFSEYDKKLTFHHKPLYQKMLIVAAGPLANFLFAIILLSGVYLLHGKPNTLPVASKIMENSAAQAAGMMEGDRILSVDGRSVDSFQDVQMAISINSGIPVQIKLDRAGEELEILLTPQVKEIKDIFGHTTKMGMIGVASKEISFERLSFFPAIISATNETYRMCEMTMKAIGQIVTGARSTQEISGPIRIAQYSGASAERGVLSFILFLVIISVNLGLINLFPIPMLDGGHLLYYTIEAIRGKALAEKYQEFGFKLGFLIVISLSALAIYNDVRSLL